MHWSKGGGSDCVYWANLCRASEMQSPGNAGASFLFGGFWYSWAPKDELLAGNSIPTWLQHPTLQFPVKRGDSAQWCFWGEQSYKGVFSYPLLSPLLHTCALPSRLDLLEEGKSSNAMTLSNQFPTTLQSAAPFLGWFFAGFYCLRFQSGYCLYSWVVHWFSALSPDSFRCLMTHLWGDGKLCHADPFCLLFRDTPR